MSINIIQGYNPSTTEPIDSRFVIASAAARYAIPAYNAYEGLLVYQQDTNILYKLIDVNNITNSTGWQEVGGVPTTVLTNASAVANVITFTRYDNTTFDVSVGSTGAAPVYAVKLSQRQSSIQTGTNNSLRLDIGRTYTIGQRYAPDEFTNVGAASNANGTTFVATNRQPARWDTSSTLSGSGNPFGIIAANTFDFTPQWQQYYNNTGSILPGKYFFNFSSSVNPDKTAPIIMPNSSSNMLSTIEANPQLDYYIDNNWIVTLSQGTIDQPVLCLTSFNSSSYEGYTIIGGKFGSGWGYYGIALLDPTGSVDPHFVAASYGIKDGEARCLVIEPDNTNILVGGKYATYQNADNTYDVRNLIRLEILSGKIDTTFTGNAIIQGGKDEAVNAIAVAIEGANEEKIYIGGDFTTVKAIDVNKNIAKLNSNGSIDTTFVTSFDPATGGFDGPVYAIAIQSDGKIIIGGKFTNYITDNPNSPGNNITYYAKNIIRLNPDGTYDGSFDTSNAFEGDSVRTIAIQPDGKILVGGLFDTYSNQRARNIARLNSDASLDTTFNIDNGFNNTIYSITLQPNYGILVGGAFSQYKDIAVRGIVRLNDSGSILNDFSGGVKSGAATVFATLPLHYGKCIIGGDFTGIFYNDTNNYKSIPYISKLYASYDVVLTTTDINNATDDSLITNTLVEVTQYS